jgi:hypothetical protein
MVLRLGGLLVTLLAWSSCRHSQPPPHSPASETPVGIPGWHLDSVRAVSLAWNVVRQLRPAGQQPECRVESVQEEADGYRLRVHEIAPGGAPLHFPRSVVSISKDSASVTVSRIPQP